LTYHQIRPKAEPACGLSVSVDTFAAQMQLLKDKGYRPIILEEAARCLESGESPGSKRVVITFDDGFKNVRTLAYPILEKYGFTATVFLVADFLGKNSAWSENKEKNRFPLLNQEDIAAMPNLSWGAHSLSHRYLTRLSESEAKEEIVLSGSRLQERLGVSIPTFCYPYGDYNDSLARIVEDAGYVCACSTRKGNRHRPDERFYLKRIPVTEISLKRFRYRLSSFYDWEHRRASGGIARYR
jgi:peptidoglycan/xylan/chitin deacetylase (PgdA/CDA1 family)